MVYDKNLLVHNSVSVVASLPLISFSGAVLLKSKLEVFNATVHTVSNLLVQVMSGSHSMVQHTRTTVL